MEAWTLLCRPGSLGVLTKFPDANGGTLHPKVVSTYAACRISASFPNGLIKGS